MTDLDRNSVLQSKTTGGIQSYPVAGSTHIYKGALCMLKADGYLAKCTATANSWFAGIAVDESDNSASSTDGATTVAVYRKGRFLLGFSDTLTQADVGSKVYATDDNVVTVTSASNKQKVGVIVEFVSASQAWVEIDAGTAAPELGT